MKPAGEWNHHGDDLRQDKITVELNGEAVSTADLDEFDKPNMRPDGTPHKFDVAYKDHPRKGTSACRTTGRRAGTRTSS